MDATLIDLHLLADMWDTLQACNVPVITAPHVGVSQRLAVVDTALGLRWRDDVEPAGEPFREVLIDPQIIQERGMLVSFLEYDAAVPGLVSSIARRREVLARWTQSDGQLWEQWLSGPAARAVQCAIDSLNGRGLIDRLSPTRRRSAKGHLRRLADGKVHVRYPMVADS
jgi:peptide deformylase